MKLLNLFRGLKKREVVISEYDENLRIDVNKYYFLMSFRFDRTRPEEFGLIRVPEECDIYLNSQDNSLWKKEPLYDFGWGEEVGFMRLPQLSFNELWFLILKSTIQENKYGAVVQVNSKYPHELRNKLIEVINTPSDQITNELKVCLKMLQENKPINRVSIVGKSTEEINEDYKVWKYIDERISEIS